MSPLPYEMAGASALSLTGSTTASISTGQGHSVNKSVKSIQKELMDYISSKKLIDFLPSSLPPFQLFIMKKRDKTICCLLHRF
jgi:hypothetical protein